MMAQQAPISSGEAESSGSGLAAATSQTIVISGVNLVEGGTLTAFREMVRAAVQHQPRWRVIALVHRVGILSIPGVTEIPFPEIKQSWLKRLAFEWFHLRALSREIAADVWVSMHDITPIISTPRQFVYCHNPAPFSTIPMRQAWRDKRFWLFTLFYGLLYRLNIQRNTAVIVQQEWIREEFFRRFNAHCVIVAHPSGIPPHEALRAPSLKQPSSFLYPTMPRVFKNIEVVGEALTLLEADPDWHGTVRITIDGSENAYAQSLVSKYGHLRSLQFIGLQSHSEMDKCYSSVDALLFPSLLETWGLPLSEAKARSIPIVAADLPYAHEAIGEYESVSFFTPYVPEDLARLLMGLHTGSVKFKRHDLQPPSAPYAEGWADLVSLLLRPTQNYNSRPSDPNIS